MRVYTLACLFFSLAYFISIEFRQLAYSTCLKNVPPPPLSIERYLSQKIIDFREQFKVCYFIFGKWWWNRFVRKLHNANY